MSLRSEVQHITEQQTSGIVSLYLGRIVLVHNELIDASADPTTEAMAIHLHIFDRYRLVNVEVFDNDGSSSLHERVPVVNEHSLIKGTALGMAPRKDDLAVVACYGGARDGQNSVVIGYFSPPGADTRTPTVHLNVPKPVQQAIGSAAAAAKTALKFNPPLSPFPVMNALPLLKGSLSLLNRGK